MPWWRDAVIYQVYPRSFADADGDGIGDLAGIGARLDHLAELGVDALWLSPFYPSPQRDDDLLPGTANREMPVKGDCTNVHGDGTANQFLEAILCEGDAVITSWR